MKLTYAIYHFSKLLYVFANLMVIIVILKSTRRAHTSFICACMNASVIDLHWDLMNKSEKIAQHKVYSMHAHAGYWSRARSDKSRDWFNQLAKKPVAYLAASFTKARKRRFLGQNRLPLKSTCGQHRKTNRHRQLRPLTVSSVKHVKIVHVQLMSQWEQKFIYTASIEYIVHCTALHIVVCGTIAYVQLVYVGLAPIIMQFV